MGVLTTVEAECKDCYKCVRACPVKAIKINTGHAQIWDERCILDGRCISVCPQHAKHVRDDLTGVRALVAQGEVLAASIAPSYVAAFDLADPTSLVTALRRLGFTYVAETAIGAEVVAMAHKACLHQEPKPKITSSCPTIVNLIEKHYPEARQYLAPVVSPMVAHARLMHQQYGERVKVVFIGPCVAKKAEADEEQFAGEIAGVLTFAELEAWLAEDNLQLAELPPDRYDTADTNWGRIFPLAGGLLRTAGLTTDMLANRMATVTGLEQCESVIGHLVAGEDLALDLIEMLACEGGCLDGPCMTGPWDGIARRQRLIKHVEKASFRASKVDDAPKTDDTPKVHDVSDEGRLGVGSEAWPEAEGSGIPSWLLRTYTDKKLRLPEPTEEKLREILTAIGKRTPADELNCGACGYDSCRDKARAVYHGVAEMEMCIPYMRAKAESLAHVIIKSTPNGTIVVDDKLTVLAVNPAAEIMFDWEAGEVVGKSLGSLMDTDSFQRVLQSRQLLKEIAEYPDHDLIAQQYIFTPEDQDIVIGIFTNITEDKERQDELARLKATTLERAQDVINRQMRVAQEIAGLLGETTAETKVLLSQLMRLMQGGEDA